jgi:hypothetical protein
MEKTDKDATEFKFWNGLKKESLKSLKSLNRLNKFLNGWKVLIILNQSESVW